MDPQLSTAKKIKRKGKKVPLKRWNSQNRFFQPRSGPFSTDALKCWVIIRQPTSNIARLRLIQSHSVYETQWYGHNTQHSSALLKQHSLTQCSNRNEQNRFNCSTEKIFIFLKCVSVWFDGSLTGYVRRFSRTNTGLRNNSCCVSRMYCWTLYFYFLHWNPDVAWLQAYELSKHLCCCEGMWPHI